VKALSLFLFGLILLSPFRGQAQVTVGAPGDEASDFPFYFTMATYQQVYAASDFSGDIVISGLTFFDQQVGPGTLMTADYEIQLSTTSAAVNGLSSTFSANLGADNTTVFTGSLSGPISSSFTIPISAFDYNPGSGNLLLTIFQTNPGAFGVGLDERAGTSGGQFSRIFSQTSTITADPSAYDINWGLVTQFDTTTVPEPSTWAMLLGSFSLLAFRRRLLSSYL
jgi:hypothetical protein